MTFSQRVTGLVPVETRKLTGGVLISAPDVVAVEHPFTVRFGNRDEASVACTPAHLEELAAGLLVSRGLLPPGVAPEDLGYRCVLSEDGRTARVAVDAVGAGAGAVGAGALPAEIRVLPVRWEGRVAAARLLELTARLEESPLFAATGGAHSAIAAGPGELMIHREDIGRHNAVDKVIGCLWLSGRLGGAWVGLLATSGRVALDVVHKAARARFPVIVSRGAPTAEAVSEAARLGVTLVGFARGDRFNVYCGHERIET